MKRKLQPGKGDDDLILEIVVFIGTCALDRTAALVICKSGLLNSIIELLKVFPSLLRARLTQIKTN